jgi:hypothetical protein
MSTVIINHEGGKYLTFTPKDPFLLSSRSINEVIAACIGNGVSRILVEEQNLSEEFFKLESLEAGEILQKFRTYEIRFAIVVSPLRLRAGRFKEMVTEEKKGRWFSVFTEARGALEWLAKV